MIKVELINKEEIKNLYKNWGEFSCMCYNTPKKYAEKVGKSCMNSGHFSGSRCEYFKFEISGISRACSLQLNRHSQGVVLNQQSQRYVDMNSANFVIPPHIEKDDRAMKIYTDLMEQSKNAYVSIQNILRENGRDKEEANEDARFALLESCETTGTWGFTLEALIHLMNLRLCSRAQWEIRQLALKMRKEVLDVLPELKDRLVPKCKRDLWCEEDKCCGLMPTRDEVELKMKDFRRINMKVSKLKDVLVEENIGEEFIFTEPTLKRTFKHLIIKHNDKVGYISNRYTIVVPNTSIDLDVEVVLLK